MVKHKILFVLSISMLLLSGCSKTEKDISYDTDLYGTYKDSVTGYDDSGKAVWVKDNTYTLKDDNTYLFNCNETVNGENRKNENEGKVISIDVINDDISKIELESIGSYVTIYKYRNMLGYFLQTDVPKSKTFDLFIKNDESTLNEGHVFNKDGLYHYCSNYDNCTDDSNYFIKYKNKDNCIYQADTNGNWTILFYVVEDGIFIKEYTKEQ